ncbi:unnamed protein product [Aphanomyces euteiches]
MEACRPWEYASACRTCSRPFGLFNPRHHCRLCGVSVCGAHSKNKTVLPHKSTQKEPQRVCDTCHKNVSESLTRKRGTRRIASQRLASSHQFPWEKLRQGHSFSQRSTGTSLTLSTFKRGHEKCLDSSTSTAYMSSIAMTTLDSPSEKSTQGSLYESPSPRSSDIDVAPSSYSPVSDIAKHANGGSSPLWRLSVIDDDAAKLSMISDEALTSIDDDDEEDDDKGSAASDEELNDIEESLNLSVLSAVPKLSEYDVDEIRAGSMRNPAAVSASRQKEKLALALGGIDHLVKVKQGLEEEIQELEIQLSIQRKTERRLKRRRKRSERHRKGGFALMEAKEYFAAQFEFKQSLRHDDDCAVTWLALAECLLECHWPREAALAASFSLEVAFSKAAVAFLGKVHLSQGNIDEAIDCFQQALS